MLFNALVISLTEYMWNEYVGIFMTVKLVINFALLVLCLLFPVNVFLDVITITRKKNENFDDDI